MARIFLSYNRSADGTAKLVRDFVKDLTEEILQISGWPRNDGVFYRDLEQPLGVDWKPRLVAALGECDVFVPLLSPAYFQSPMCGREWWLIEERRNEHARRHNGQRPEVIVPVLWEQLEESEIPDFAGNLQYLEAETEILYGDNGLRLVAANRKGRYRKAVAALARRIKNVANQKALEASTRTWDFNAVPDMFTKSTGPVGDTRRRPTPAARSGGWNTVHFVVAAATATEISDLPAEERPMDETRYGYEAIEWKPYLAGESLAHEASSVAMGGKLTPSSFNIGGNLPQLIDDAEHERRLVVVLIDPRTLEMKQYGDFVRPYNQGNANRLHTGIVVAWDEDTATKSRRAELESAVSDVFFANQSKDPTYSDCAGSLDQFGNELRNVIVKIQALVMNDPRKKVRAARPISSSDPDETGGLPQLDGPREA